MKPKVSIVVPFHWMDNWPVFLTRCLASIEAQTFKDYEVILMKVGNMPETSNRVIEGAKGEIIKVLYMDDYFARTDSLQTIVDNFTPETQWLVTGCLHQVEGSEPAMPHMPEWNPLMEEGVNTLGSPSVLSLRNDGHLLFDEKLSWLLDCDLYTRYYKKYGPPTLVNDLNVIMGIHDGQMTNVLSDDKKQEEFTYLKNKSHE